MKLTHGPRRQRFERARSVVGMEDEGEWNAFEELRKNEPLAREILLRDIDHENWDDVCLMIDLMRMLWPGIEISEIEANTLAEKVEARLTESSGRISRTTITPDILTAERVQVESVGYAVTLFPELKDRLIGRIRPQLNRILGKYEEYCSTNVLPEGLDNSPVALATSFLTTLDASDRGNRLKVHIQERCLERIRQLASKDSLTDDEWGMLLVESVFTLLVYPNLRHGIQELLTPKIMFIKEKILGDRVTTGTGFFSRALWSIIEAQSAIRQADGHIQLVPKAKSTRPGPALPERLQT